MTRGLALGEYFENIEDFLGRLPHLQDEENPDDYSEGYQRIRFYPQLLAQQSPFYIEEDSSRRPRVTAFEYESKLADRLLHYRRPSILVVIGGLGSGKSTTWRYVSRMLPERATKLLATDGCTCRSCHRLPVLIDCLDVTEASTPERTSNQVLRRIRLRIYEQILSEWLVSHGVSPHEAVAIDEEYLVLRRLLIANDLMKYYSPELDREVDLRHPDLRLDQNLLSYPPTLELVRDLTKQYRAGAGGEMDNLLSNMGRNRELSVEFMAMLLRLFSGTCEGRSPLSFLVVDNLDQLPNRHITHLVNELFDISLKVPTVPIILPLRPSSISVKGFRGKPDYRYHWGPSNYEMVLKRLENRVLTRSFKDLSNAYRVDSQTRIFNVRPREDEVQILILASFLYAKILLAGIALEAQGVVDRTLRIHDDHKQTYGRLQIPDAIFSDLARTLGALVGTCSRYAIEEMQRYFSNIYHEAGFLLATVRELNAGDVEIGVRHALPRLVDALISNEGGPEFAERRVNLFRPAGVSSNHDWPTIVPLRILQYLSVTRRATVKSVLSRLRVYGVPAAITLEYLNRLHEKDRLLVWFSDNRNLKFDEANMDHDVVISEHGLTYYTDLIGDFEYCWYCASEVSKRTYRRSHLSFTAKLSEYRNLVTRVAETEIKQISFRRCMKVTLSGGEEAMEIREMFALSMLYKGITRILGSLNATLRYGAVSRDYALILQRRLIEIANLVLRWQDEYEAIWGGRGFLTQYELEIADALAAVDQILEGGVVGEDVREVLGSLSNSWRGDPETGLRSGSKMEVAGDSLVDLYLREVGGGLRQGRSFVMQLMREGGEQKPGGGPLGRALRRLFEHRAEIRRLLTKTIPTFSEVMVGLEALRFSTERALEIIEIREGIPQSILKWIEKEDAAFRQLIAKLEANEYLLPDIGRFFEEERSEGARAMGERKARCNRVLDTLLELAQRLDCGETSHLRYRWS